MVTGKKATVKRRQFIRFQLTALTATCIDFIITIITKEYTGFHYTIAVATGATAGAITAFTLNRYWVFRAVEQHPAGQAIRYVLVAFGSVVLNTIGTYLVTEILITPYLISKALISLIIGFTYSYHFAKRFVFYG
jgi:putative flippase GtrA